MKYLPLFELRCIHPYYSDQRCTDIAFLPTMATQQLLKNFRCVMKPLPDGIRVMIQVTEQDEPFVTLRSDDIFAFQLRLENPDFALFTELTALDQLTRPTYTNPEQNGANPIPLTLAARQTLFSEALAVSQPGKSEPFTLSGRPLPGLQAADFAIEGLGSIKQPESYDASTKIIRVKTAAVGEGTPFVITYAAVPQLAKGIFADVEIRYANTGSTVREGAAQFQINFEAKKSRWKYYLITDRTEGEFSIKDQAAPPIVFSAENTSNPGQPDPSDVVARMLADQFPTTKQLRFVSDAPVLCRASARKSIQLQLNGNLIVETLPNPSLRNYSTIDIHENGTLRKEEVLYQVVKYLTH